MIDIIANIASILGFTMQMNDKFFAHGMNKEQADNEMLLLFLKQLSVKSKAIKEIHQKYHSLSNDFRLVAVFLTNPVIYEKIVTNRSRALRNALKESLQTPSARIAQTQLSAQLRPCFENLLVSIKDESHLSVEFSGINDCEMKAILRKILNAQKEIFQLHQQFCGIMKTIGSYPLGNWGDSEFDFIKTNQRVFISAFYSIIDYADIILMGYLDIYHCALNLK